MQKELHHLRLLSIFHYIYALITGVIGCGFILFFMLVFSRFRQTASDSPAFDEASFIMVLAAGMLAFVLIMTAAECLAGYLLARRKGYMYCMVIAVIESTSFPLGTVLGVFTLVTLLQPEVQELFGRGPGMQTPTTDH
ncbi:MAG: hypothetical protein R3336_07500 [Phycisphaeraceae bacterium]|nr:hypothetical protein [Phycisphaeraceae bacterium]